MVSILVVAVDEEEADVHIPEEEEAREQAARVLITILLLITSNTDHQLVGHFDWSESKT